VPYLPLSTFRTGVAMVNYNLYILYIIYILRAYIYGVVEQVCGTTCLFVAVGINEGVGAGV